MAARAARGPGTDRVGPSQAAAQWQEDIKAGSSRARACLSMPCHIKCLRGKYLETASNHRFSGLKRREVWQWHGERAIDMQTEASLACQVLCLEVNTAQWKGAAP